MACHGMPWDASQASPAGAHLSHGGVRFADAQHTHTLTHSHEAAPGPVPVSPSPALGGTQWRRWRWRNLRGGGGGGAGPLVPCLVGGLVWLVVVSKCHVKKLRESLSR